MHRIAVGSLGKKIWLVCSTPSPKKKKCQKKLPSCKGLKLFSDVIESPINMSERCSVRLTSTMDCLGCSFDVLYLGLVRKLDYICGVHK